MQTRHKNIFIIPQRLLTGGILYAKSVNEVIVIDVERMEETENMEGKRGRTQEEVEEDKMEDEFFSRKEVIEELDRIDKEGKFVSFLDKRGR